MGRAAAHTEAEVFEAANRLAASGAEVTAPALREALGGKGSYTTIYRHFEAWVKARATAPAPVVLAMPDAVRAAFDQVWAAAAQEAGREIAAIRERADADVAQARKQVEDAKGAIAQLEAEARETEAEVERLAAELEAAQGAARQAATEAAAREAGLSTTATELRSQLEALRVELARAHEDEGLRRSERDSALASIDDLRVELASVQQAERAGFEALAAVKADAGNLAEQLREQKARSVEAIGRLEKSKQAAEAEAMGARKELRELSARLAKVEGERDALHAQVSQQADMLKAFAPAKGKGADK